MKENWLVGWGFMIIIYKIYKYLFNYIGGNFCILWKFYEVFISFLRKWKLNKNEKLLVYLLCWWCILSF